MESTGNLLSGLNHLKGNKLPKLELRVILGMNLIRFVNLLIDNHQSTYFAQSMTTIATQLGLPLYFIELRHAATHEDLPSLAILKTATIQVSLLPLLPLQLTPPLGTRLALHKSLAPSHLYPIHPITRYPTHQKLPHNLQSSHQNFHPRYFQIFFLKIGFIKSL